MNFGNVIFALFNFAGSLCLLLFGMKLMSDGIQKSAGARIQGVLGFMTKNRDHYDALAAYAKKEHDEDQRPAIKNAIDLSGYDTVFIGYPIWWYTFPMIIYTLFDTVDFSGKTVVPFNTHMGSRDGGTYKTVREKAKGATVLEGLPVSMKEAEGGAGKSVEKWLTKHGLKKYVESRHAHA